MADRTTGLALRCIAEIVVGRRLEPPEELARPQIACAGFVHLRIWHREVWIGCFGFAQFRFACFILMGRETSRGVAFGAAASHEILVRLPGLLAIRASGKPVKSGFFDKSAYQQGDDANGTHLMFWAGQDCPSTDRIARIGRF